MSKQIAHHIMGRILAGTLIYTELERVIIANYQSLRSRLLDHFWFDARLATEVEPELAGRSVVFGDQTIYMGQALLVLASEMAVHRRDGVDTTDARDRISQLLDGFELLETRARERYGNMLGLFVRDDIFGPDDPRLNHRFDNVQSDWQNPDQENDTPSGDQIIGLMIGLFGVVRYSGDDGLITRARAMSSRLFDYVRQTYFVLRLPNGDETRRGSDMRWFASLVHGLNQAVTGEDHFGECRIELGPLQIPLNGIAAFWDSSNTPDMIAQFTGQSITIPGLGTEIELNSFALHMLLTVLSPSEVWSQDELENVALRANHHLSMLLYCEAHGTQPNGFDAATANHILNACPDHGPNAGINPATGWQHDNRWIRCTNISEPNVGQIEYNGLDWLVMHNLVRLVFQ